MKDALFVGCAAVVGSAIGMAIIMGTALVLDLAK